MLYIDKEGYIDAERIILKTFKNIERGQMDAVNGIVVHQTDSTTAKARSTVIRPKVLPVRTF